MVRDRRQLGRTLLPTAEQQPQQMVWGPPCPTRPTHRLLRGCSGSSQRLRGPVPGRSLGIHAQRRGPGDGGGSSCRGRSPLPAPSWESCGQAKPEATRGPEPPPQRQPHPAAALLAFLGAAAQVSSLCGSCPKCPLLAASQSPAPASTIWDQRQTQDHNAQRPDSRHPGAEARTVQVKRKLHGEQGAPVG